MINGVKCHERGCPEAWKDYDVPCRECGCDFKPEERGQRVCPGCMNPEPMEPEGPSTFGEIENPGDELFGGPPETPEDPPDRIASWLDHMKGRNRNQP